MNETTAPQSSSTPAHQESATNSQAEVNRRAMLGQISWAGPLVLVTARTVLAVAAQAVVAAIFMLRHHPSPWLAAAPWWTVYGTLVDIGCLALMVHFLRQEKIGLRDLIGKIRLRWGRDIFVGLGFFLLIFPFFVVGGLVGSKLVYGSIQPHLPPGSLADRALPLWAVIYSLGLWWIIWSPTEEITYQAYSLPRLQALFGRPWIALLLTAFWWGLQHCFLPLILDWDYIAWRFFAFFPGAIVALLVYSRTRRLPPLIFAHCPMDIVAAVMTLRF